MEFFQVCKLILPSSPSLTTVIEVEDLAIFNLVTFPAAAVIPENNLDADGNISCGLL